MKRKTGKLFCLLLPLLLLLPGCRPQVMDGDGMLNSYRQISQEEAMKMMEQDDGHIVVDVRTEEEYREGHIPGAVLIPNESIGTEQPEELPDLHQIILIYCRSGNRSKQAAQKLFDMGYTHIYEFGGINTWTGEIVAETVESTEQTSNDTPSAASSEEEFSMDPVPILMIEINGRRFTASLAENSSAEAFLEKLSEGPLELALHDYGSFEKVGELPWELPANDEQLTTSPGDVILYQGDQITIYYDENTWSLTRLAAIDTDPEELQAALGEGDVTVTFWIEWTE